MINEYYIVVDSFDYPIDSSGYRTPNGATRYNNLNVAMNKAKEFTNKFEEPHTVMQIRGRYVCQKTAVLHD